MKGGNAAVQDTLSASILRRGRAVLETEAAAVQSAVMLLGTDFVQTVLTILGSQARVCTTGIGKAGLIARKIGATLASTGTAAYNLDPLDALHGDIGMVAPGDVVLAFSKSGACEIAQLLGVLKDRGCTIVLVTAEPTSPAARHADFILDIGRHPEACPLGLAPSSSAAVMLAVGDALALALMEVRGFRPEQYARLHPAGSLGRSLMKVSEIMRREEGSPVVNQLARLVDCYHAISRAPRRAGAVSVVDPSDRLIGLVTQGDVFRAVLHGGKNPLSPVVEVMTRNPKRVLISDFVTTAYGIMREFAIDELPVVDGDDRLQGLLDIQDLAAMGFVVESR